MNSTSTTTSVVEAFIDFARNLTVLAEAGQAEVAGGNRATATALLDTIEGEVSTITDSLGAALGIQTGGFGGVSDSLYGLVSALVPAVSMLADVLDQHVEVA